MKNQRKSSAARSILSNSVNRKPKISLKMKSYFNLWPLAVSHYSFQMCGCNWEPSPSLFFKRLLFLFFGRINWHSRQKNVKSYFQFDNEIYWKWTPFRVPFRNNNKTSNFKKPLAIILSPNLVIQSRAVTLAIHHSNCNSNFLKTCRYEKLYPENVYYLCSLQKHSY